MINKRNLIKVADIFFPERRLKLYDEYFLTTEDLEENRFTLSKNKDGITDRIENIIWFLPPIDNINSGGVSTILKLAEFFSDNYLTKNHFVFEKKNTK